MIKVYCPKERKEIYINPNHIVYMYSIKEDLTMVKLVGNIQFGVKETIEEILALINEN